MTQRMRWITILAGVGLGLAMASWAGNRLDMFARDRGNPDDPYDTWHFIAHPFITDKFDWRTSLFVSLGFGGDYNVMDPAAAPHPSMTWTNMLKATRESIKNWTSVSIASIEMSRTVIPSEHNFPLYDGQTLTAGATGLDGYNIVTFQDPLLTAAGAAGMSIIWAFYEPFDLDTYRDLPPGIVIDTVTAPVPGQPLGQPTLVIDFNGDGFVDLRIPKGRYEAGEAIEGDVWMSQTLAWVHYPDSPTELDDWVTSNGLPNPIHFEDTLGTYDAQGTIVHEMGHVLGMAHANLERATMYWTRKGNYDAGFRYPTDPWDRRTPDLDDHVAAALIYPGHDSSRGAITGRALAGENFDGLPDYTSGIVDALLYANIEIHKHMTTGTLPAYIPDKTQITTGTNLTQEDLDTSAALWFEKIVTIQTGEDVRLAIWPNPASLRPPAPLIVTTTTVQAHLEASPQYFVPGLPPFDRYVVRLDNSGVYYNDFAGQATNNISQGFDLFFGYQTIPTEYYGGSTNLAERRMLGPDSPLPLTTVTTIPLVLTGDDPTSWVYVPVRAGEITAGIDIYSNMGGLPTGVTPTPLPGITPTPAPPGNTRFTPPQDNLVPQSSEFQFAAAPGDVDRDGDIDLYICNAISAGGSPVGQVNRIYINTLYEPGANPPYTRTLGRRSADGKPVYEDRTFGVDGTAGTADDRLPIHLDSSFVAKVADFNNDGWLDVFVSNEFTRTNPVAALNRLYINRGGAQAGFFDDWTTRTRTDPAIGIPLWFTPTIMPGLNNQDINLPFNWSQSTKSDAGDIDGDGDIDIVVSNIDPFYFGFNPVTVFDICVTPPAPSFVPIQTEQILINHVNDIDPNTRGFYFTDETLGLDNRFGEYVVAAVNPANPTNIADTMFKAADRLPPIYPFRNSVGASIQVALAPLIGDSSLDLVIARTLYGPPTAFYGPPTDAMPLMIYENADIDGDGVADGYFRLATFGDCEYGCWTIPGTTSGTLTVAVATQTGLGGFGCSNSLRNAPNSQDCTPCNPPTEEDLWTATALDRTGVAIGDFDNRGFPGIISLNENVATQRLFPVPLPQALERFQGGVAGGASIEYEPEFWWHGLGPYTWYIGVGTADTPFTTGSVGYLTRHATIQDFDNDGDYDAWIVFQSNLNENNVNGLPVPSQYFTNNAFNAMTNATGVATSATSKARMYVTTFDFDLDGDLDVFESVQNGTPSFLLNELYRPTDLFYSNVNTLFNSATDNPAFYDATPKFVPPYMSGLARVLFDFDDSNLSVYSDVGDLNGDWLPDIVVANGALYSHSGSATDVLINHGEPINEGARVFYPIGSSWPGPSLFTWTSTPGVFNIGGRIRNRYLNHYTPAYKPILVDVDVDGDYDIFETTLGTGARLYANMDSAEMLTLPYYTTNYGINERVFNSIPDNDFLGDAIFIPSNVNGCPLYLAGQEDPSSSPSHNSGAQKKQMNRGAAVGDVNNDNFPDIVIANGLPSLQTPGFPTNIGGAPNVLLLNGMFGAPPGNFIDATESHLPTQLMPTATGGWYWEGVHDNTVDVAMADFDDDGFLEIIFLNEASALSSGTRFLDNLGNGQFRDSRVPGSPDSTWVLPQFRNRRPSSILIGDFDRKGDPTEDLNGNNLLDPGEDVNHNGILDWWDTTETEDLNGNGVLDFGEDGLAPFGPANGQIDSADLNGDGIITARRPGVFDGSWDVFITFTDGPCMLFLNTLPGGPFGFFDVSSTFLPQTLYSHNGCDAGDVDLDGDLDIVVAVSTAPTQPHVLVFLNDGRGRFTYTPDEIPVEFSVLAPPGVIDSSRNVCRDVDLLDVDLDGDLDMYLTYEGYTALTMSFGALNTLFVNRLRGEGFNSVTRYQPYRTPFLIRLSPGAAFQGTETNVTIIGEGFTNEQLARLDLGEGITIGPLTRVSPTAFSARVTIATNAPPGTRDAVVTTADQRTAQLFQAFTVIARKTATKRVWGAYK